MENKPMTPRDIKRNDDSLLAALDRAKKKAITTTDQLASINEAYRALMREHTLLKSAMHEQNDALLAENARLKAEVLRLERLLSPKVEEPPKDGEPTESDLENA